MPWPNVGGLTKDEWSQLGYRIFKLDRLTPVRLSAEKPSDLAEKYKVDLEVEREIIAAASKLVLN